MPTHATCACVLFFRRQILRRSKEASAPASDALTASGKFMPHAGASLDEDSLSLRRGGQGTPPHSPSGGGGGGGGGAGTARRGGGTPRRTGTNSIAEQRVQRQAIERRRLQEEKAAAEAARMEAEEEKAMAEKAAAEATELASEAKARADTYLAALREAQEATVRLADERDETQKALTMSFKKPTTDRGGMILSASMAAAGGGGGAVATCGGAGGRTVGAGSSDGSGSSSGGSLNHPTPPLLVSSSPQQQSSSPLASERTASDNSSAASTAASPGDGRGGGEEGRGGGSRNGLALRRDSAPAVVAATPQEKPRSDVSLELTTKLADADVAVRKAALGHASRLAPWELDNELIQCVVHTLTGDADASVRTAARTALADFAPATLKMMVTDGCDAACLAAIQARAPAPRRLGRRRTRSPRAAQTLHGARTHARASHVHDTHHTYTPLHAPASHAAVTHAHLDTDLIRVCVCVCAAERAHRRCARSTRSRPARSCRRAYRQRHSSHKCSRWYAC